MISVVWSLLPRASRRETCDFSDKCRTQTTQTITKKHVTIKSSNYIFLTELVSGLKSTPSIGRATSSLRMSTQGQRIADRQRGPVAAPRCIEPFDVPDFRTSEDAMSELFAPESTPLRQPRPASALPPRTKPIKILAKQGEWVSLYPEVEGNVSDDPLLPLTRPWP